MNKEDRVRACYQHCCLKYVAGEKMTNESLRGRLEIAESSYPIASKIISDAIVAGWYGWMMQANPVGMRNTFRNGHSFMLRQSNGSAKKARKFYVMAE